MHKPNGKKMYLLFSNILLACLLLGVLAPAHAAQIESAFPLYYQVDYPEPLFEWRGEQKSVASSGCGAVCVAMVLSHFYQDTSYTPSALFR